MKTTPIKLLMLIILHTATVAATQAQESILPRASNDYVERLVAVAQKNYPEVTARQYQTAIAKNNITKTNVGWLDAFSVSYYYRPTQGAVDIVNPNIFNGYQLGVSLNLGAILQKPFATKEAKAQYKVAQLEEKQYNLTITALVKARYFAYLEQLGNLKLRTRAYTDAEALVKLLRNKFEKNEVTFDDYQRALIQSTEQNQQIIHAESGVFTTKSALEELLGEKLENIK
jgi:outer membrane protein TolC